MGKKDFRIQGVTTDLNDLLKKICKNRIEPKSDFLRPKIRQIVDSFPEELKQPPEDKVKKIEINVTSVNPFVMEQFSNICRNLGVSESQLMKIELYKIIQETPPTFKD